MAECCICGNVNSDLPRDWVAWECKKCYRDQDWNSLGTFDTVERAKVRPHASAVGVFRTRALKDHRQYDFEDCR